jgi:hypothetical protein
MALTVFRICERVVGLVRGRRLELTTGQRAQLEALDYDGLVSGNAQDEAVTCVRHFEFVRDSLLQAYPWVFARRSASLAELTLTVSGWRHMFALPPDCARLLGVVHKGRELPLWEVVGQTVGTHLAPVETRYTAKVAAVASWPSLFVDAFTSRLAVEVVTAVQGSGSGAQGYEQQAQTAISEAYRLRVIDEGGHLPVWEYAWDDYAHDGPGFDPLWRGYER